MNKVISKNHESAIVRQLHTVYRVEFEGKEYVYREVYQLDHELEVYLFDHMGMPVSDQRLIRGIIKFIGDHENPPDLPEEGTSPDPDPGRKG